MAIRTIIPITELEDLCVSDVREYNQCQRKALEHLILRKEPRQLRIPLFVGQCVHVGTENFYNKKPKKTVMRRVKRTIKRILKENTILDEDVGSIEVQKAIIQGVVLGYMNRYKSDLKKYKVIATEKSYRFPIPGTKLNFIGTIDLIVEDSKGRRWIIDFKTSSGLETEATHTMEMNMQLHMYAKAYYECTGKRIYGFILGIIRKPGIRLKKNQTFAEYIQEIEDLYAKQPDKYFKRETLRVTKQNMENAWFDFQSIASEISVDKLGHFCDSVPSSTKKSITYNCHQWPRTGGESSFNSNCWSVRGKACPYLEGCKFGWTPVRLAKFKQREEKPRGEIIEAKNKKKAKV